MVYVTGTLTILAFSVDLDLRNWWGQIAAAEDMNSLHYKLMMHYGVADQEFCRKSVEVLAK